MQLQMWLRHLAILQKVQARRCSLYVRQKALPCIVNLPVAPLAGNQKGQVVPWIKDIVVSQEAVHQASTCCYSQGRLACIHRPCCISWAEMSAFPGWRARRCIRPEHADS